MMFLTNVEKQIKILILLLFSSNFLFSQCEDCIESLELLSKRATLLNVSYTKSLTQKDSLLDRITYLNNEITLYRTGLKYPENRIIPLVPKKIPKIPNPTKPSTALTNSEDIEQNKVFLDALKKSKKDISNLQKTLNAAKNTLGTQKKDIVNLQKELNKLSKELTSQLARNKELEYDVSKFESILDCIKKFESEIKQPSSEVTQQLSKTRKDYEEYKRLLRVKSTDVAKKDALITNVINAYESFKGKEKQMDCGGIRLSIFQDYLTINDYMNISEIYGKNYGNAVTKLDSTNQINEANRRVLDAAGVIMEKGTYDDRSLIISKLKSYITPERRPGPINSEVKHNLETIPNAFKKEKYLEALNTYSKYEKYLNLDEVKSEKHLIDEVKYSIGSILLWDLGSYDQELFSIIDNDWLSGYQNYKQCGLTYLNDLVNDKSVRLDLRKKASITLNKYYE